MIKISVIIPIYNVSCYLKECLESIVNQSLKEIEIICIDDCSTDNSYEILLEYSNKDTRFKVLKNNFNESVGYNRNLGIKLAKGEYISFIDSDDYISLNYLEDLYNTAKKYDSDIVNTLNIYRVFNDKCEKDFYSFRNIEFQSSFDLMDIENYFSKKAIAPYSVNKLYKTSFLILNNLYFLNTKFGAGEDTNFIIKLMLNNPKISFNNKSIYYYRDTPNSLTKIVNNNINVIINCIHNMNDAIEYCKNFKPELLPQVYYKSLIPVINFYLACSEKIKKDVYEEIYKFVNLIEINKSILDKKIIYKDYIYMNYLALISSKNYNEYLFNLFQLEKLLHIEQSLYNSGNWFRLFGYNKTDYYITIIFFGIKIVLKRKN